MCEALGSIPSTTGGRKMIDAFLLLIKENRKYSCPLSVPKFVSISTRQESVGYDAILSYSTSDWNLNYNLLVKQINSLAIPFVQNQCLSRQIQIF